jgi:hypothetical protein
MNIQSVTALVFAGSVLLGCGTVPEAMAPEAFEPETALAGAAAGISIDLPFRATWTADGPPPPPIIPPPHGSCSEDAIYLLIHTYTGEATHLGRFTLEASVCGYGESGAYDGYGTIVFVNGDVLTLEFENGYIHAIEGPIIVGRDDFSFTGGTGRFASATGGGTGEGRLDTRVGYGSGVMEGTIRYQASDRAIRP